jgi:hypothetical protein
MISCLNGKAIVEFIIRSESELYRIVLCEFLGILTEMYFNPPPPGGTAILPDNTIK